MESERRLLWDAHRIAVRRDSEELIHLAGICGGATEGKELILWKESLLRPQAAARETASSIQRRNAWLD